MEELRLWMNNLSGPIPPELGNLSDLLWLVLSSNQLSGPMPEELGNLGNLVYLYLDFNDPSLCVSTQELLEFSRKLPQYYGPADLCPPP